MPTPPDDDGPPGGTGEGSADSGADAPMDSSGAPDPTDDGDEGTSTGGPVAGECTPFPPVADFAEPGPFGPMQEPGGDACTIFRPASLGDNGLRHPVILWGNGTTATPGVYGAVLQHWATHGFIVAAANTTNAGTGQEMIGCLNWVTAQNDDPASPYADAVDLAHVGASGHSQGGGGTLMAGQDPRVTVTAPLQPYTEQGFGGYDQAAQSNQNGPMFLMSGDQDTISPPNPEQQRVFDDTNVPTIWGTLAGANHIFTAIGNISGYRSPATAWFRFHLMCDELAGPVFYDDCTLCSDEAWTVQTKNWE
ncbi:MAG: hypothetical protein AAF721_26905, partial [Myxococcota bacterium]